MKKVMKMEFMQILKFLLLEKQLFLSYDSLSIIDSVKIPELAADIGFARLPNGYGPFAKHTII